MIHSTNDAIEIEKWCKLCIDNFVYIPRGQLYFYYKHPGCIRYITVWVDGDFVVAAACYIPSATFTLQIFVKPAYRKSGIGKKLIQEMLHQIEDQMTVDISDYRIRFWRQFLSDKILLKGK